MTRSIRRWFILPGLAVLVTAGCSGSPQDAPGRGASGTRSIRVRTAAVTIRDVTYQIKALGSLEAQEMVQVTAEVEGATTAVLFHEGDRVTPQTVLVRIDPERHRLEGQRAEAALVRAQADLRRSEQDLARREELARQQLVPAEELNRARADSERLAAEVAAAKAALDIALQNQRRSEVRAPKSGVINTRAVDPGQYIRAGAVLATLVDVSRLKLRFKVSEGESLRAREGQTVAFQVGPVRAKEFAARIYHVGEIADPTTRQVEVLAWVDNPGPLKPGFFAQVTLASDSRKGAVVVPEGAVQASEKGFVAFIVEEGKARLRPVQVGLRTESGEVEILSGLKSGETVVVAGSDLLADGVAVEDAEGETSRERPERGNAQ